MREEWTPIFPPEPLAPGQAPEEVPFSEDEIAEDDVPMFSLQLLRRSERLWRRSSMLLQSVTGLTWPVMQYSSLHASRQALTCQVKTCSVNVVGKLGPTCSRFELNVCAHEHRLS